VRSEGVIVIIFASAFPIACGALQETIYLHSGEMSTGAVDLDAGGRAGWNVALRPQLSLADDALRLSR